MRALFLCPRIPWPLNDGGNLAMMAMAELWKSEGYDVTLFCLNTRKHHIDPQSLPERLTERIQLISSTIDTTIRPWDAFLNLFARGESYNVQRFHSWDAEDRLKKILQDQSFDVVVFESLFTTPYLPIVRRYSDATILLRSHNVEHMIWDRLASACTSWLKKTYLHFLARRMESYEKRVLSQFDGILSISTSDELVYKKWSPEVPLLTIPMSIDLKRYELQSTGTANGLSLFHLGAMDWMPNREGIQWFLEEIWPSVHREFPELEFHLAGRAFPPAMMTGLPDGVKAHGAVEDAADFMLDKPIMVVPLKAGGGIRIKILEGMARGKAIISTRIGAEGIPVTHGQQLMLADTAEEFIQAIRQCQDPEFRNMLGLRARHWVEKEYSGESMAARLFPWVASLPKRRVR